MIGRLDAAQQTMIDALITNDTVAGWDRAVETWRSLGQPYELAMSLHYGSMAALAAGNAETAAAQQKEASRIAASLGILPPAGAAPNVPSGAPSGVESDGFGLTPRERDVLELVAIGLSNRQIATRLYISPSTAGVHVSHILAKLGAATRTEATAIAHRRGLVNP